MLGKEKRFAWFLSETRPGDSLPAVTDVLVYIKNELNTCPSIFRLASSYADIHWSVISLSLKFSIQMLSYVNIQSHAPKQFEGNEFWQKYGDTKGFCYNLIHRKQNHRNRKRYSIMEPPAGGGNRAVCGKGWEWNWPPGSNKWMAKAVPYLRELLLEIFSGGAPPTFLNSLVAIFRPKYRKIPIINAFLLGLFSGELFRGAYYWKLLHFKMGLAWQ